MQIAIVASPTSRARVLRRLGSAAGSGPLWSYPAAVHAMDVSINGDRRTLTDVAGFREWLDDIGAAGYLEVWLTRPSGEALCVLANGPRAWLMYLRREGDPGFSSRNPKYDGPTDAKLDFVLSNGQLDQYPVAWTIPTETAFEAADHFFLFDGKDPSIDWHDDSVRER